MSQRKEFRELADPEHAREVIANLPLEPGAESVPISNAGGRVLAERIDAALDVPGFDRASMDGIAVRAADTFGADEREPASLERIGAVHAGARPETVVEEGTTVEISTGAVLPPGADAVVMAERIHERGSHIEVETAVAPGENVMTAGADIGAGQRIAGPGRLLTAREIAVLAALGHESVSVRAKPRVGIVSTGDELVRPGAAIDHGRGQIYDVNSHAIESAVEAAGGDPKLYPHVGDDYDRMYEVLEQAAEECDLVLSSGSTSASAVDVIYDVIEAGGELLLHGVAVKPGKPMLIGTMGSGASAYIGLPGYPVSALMVFRRFVAPRIREAAGQPTTRELDVQARMVAEERFGEGRMRLLPVGTVRDGEGALLAYPVDKGSGATTSLLDADGVVEVPAQTAYVAPDEQVTVHLFEADVRPPSVLGVGEDDPRLLSVLDTLSHPRYLTVGTREGLRRYNQSIPDFVVTAGPQDGTIEGTRLAHWTRAWGLLVPDGNPAAVSGIDDLVDRDLRFANLRGTALRTALEDQLGELASERDQSTRELQRAIAGFGMARPAHESAARLVAAGEADVGLGLASSTEQLPLDLVQLGEQPVSVYARPDRAAKSGVKELSARLESLEP